MFKQILFISLLAITFTANAVDLKNTKRISRESLFYCAEEANFAAQLMEARQRNSDPKRIYSIIKDNPTRRKIGFEAYKFPIFTKPSDVEKVVTDFRQYIYNSCINYMTDYKK